MEFYAIQEILRKKLGARFLDWSILKKILLNCPLVPERAITAMIAIKM